MDPKWLEWAKRLQATAQNGLQYAQSPFDRERFQLVQSIAAEILTSHTTLEPVRVHEIMDSETGYATPKVDVRGVVFKDHELLMVREKFDGRWTVPGGWADVSETPSQGSNFLHAIVFPHGVIANVAYHDGHVAAMNFNTCPPQNKTDTIGKVFWYGLK